MSHQIVPTRATALIARKILADTHEAGADAVLRHIDDLEPTQYVALVAILAKAAADKVAPPVPGGKPLKAIILTEGATSTNDYIAPNVMMAGIIIALIPLLIFYPIMQRFLLRGLTVGGVKE